MPVRFDADGEDYNRTLSLGAQSAFSVSIWAKISVDRNTFATPWSLALSTSNYCLLQTASDGTTMALYDTNAGVTLGPRAMTVGTWYWWGVSHALDQIIVKSRSATDTAFTTSTTGTSGNITLTTLNIGESIFTGEWLNGSVAGFKFWLGTLTAEELENEFLTLTPQRTTSLRLWQPFVIPGTADWSGNGNTLSGGTGTAVDNDGPPAIWRSGAVPLIYLPSAPSDVTATFSGSTPALTGSFAVDASVSASLSASLPAPVTGSFSATATVSASLSSTTPAVTGTFSGALGVAVQLTASSPAVTGSFTAESGISGSLSGVLPATTGQALIDLGVTATFSGSTPALLGSFSIDVEAITVLLSGSTPAVTGSFVLDVEDISGTGEALVSGAGILPVVVMGAGIERVITGAGTERVITGGGIQPVTPTGPAITTITVSGAGAERVITGPSVEREITGVAV